MQDGKNVSVVVQGPVHGRPDEPLERQLTRHVLASVRQQWPQAEIILSTWRGSVTSNLIYDELILNEDPGAVTLNDTNLSRFSNNLNRQIISTRNGLVRATRQYAVKLRSDCHLVRPIDFGPLFTGKRNDRWSILEAKVMTLFLYTRHPLRRPVLFHLSDLFHAGLRTDLLTIWNIPVVDEPAFTRALNPQRLPLINAYPEADYLMRCAPEQYVAECLAKKLDPKVHLKHLSDGSLHWLFLWLNMLANNFLLVTPEEAGVQLQARISNDSSNWDLFGEQDRTWINYWEQTHVPFTTRLTTALRYNRARLALAAPHKIRRFVSILLRYPLARSSERWG